MEKFRPQEWGVRRKVFRIPHEWTFVKRIENKWDRGYACDSMSPHIHYLTDHSPKQFRGRWKQAKIRWLRKWKTL